MTVLKKIAISICAVIIIITVVYICFNLGYSNGKIEEKNRKEYIIKDSSITKSSEELRKEGYNLILKGEPTIENRKIIPNTSLSIEKESLSKNNMVLNYSTNDKSHGVNVEFKYYILEKKVGEKWYQIEPIGRGGFGELKKEIRHYEVIKMGKEYQIYKDFKEYAMNGLPRGKYRIVFGAYMYMNIALQEQYTMAEFEIR